jgi:hypothetical protein
VEFLTLNVALAYAMHLLSPTAREARKPTIKVILHLETKFAYLRNSPPSPRGRASASLLDYVLSGHAGGPDPFQPSCLLNHAVTIILEELQC